MRLKLVKNNNDEPMIKIDSNVVQDMVMNERYAYEALGNHDVEDNDVDEKFEHVEHQHMHLDHEYVITSPMMSELNWDVINASVLMTFHSHHLHWVHGIYKILYFIIENSFKT